MEKTFSTEVIQYNFFSQLCSFFKPYLVENSQDMLSLLVTQLVPYPPYSLAAIGNLLRFAPTPG
jgi:hypothetical protein